MNSIKIMDDVVQKMYRFIAMRIPEHGGALFGPRGSQTWITKFVYDQDAVTTNVTYTPSAWLVDAVPKIETDTGLAFRGIVHSHPSNFRHPSGPDLYAAAKFLRLNAGLETMHLPIIVPSALDDPSEWLHWYCIERATPRMSYSDATKVQTPKTSFPDVRVIKKPVSIMPLREDVETLLGKRTKNPTGQILNLGASCYATEYEVDGVQVVHVIDELYPHSPPALVLASSGDYEMVSLPSWTAGEGRQQCLQDLGDALREAIQCMREKISLLEG